MSSLLEATTCSLQQAVKEIRRLNEELAALRKSREWIPAETPPNHDKYVLGKTKPGTKTIVSLYRGEWLDEDGWTQQIVSYMELPE